MALELKMLRIWTIFFSCGWLVSSQGTDAPGAILKIDLGTIEHAVSNAMTESNILQKLAAAASAKQPGVKPIKGISRLQIKDVQPPEITLTFLPATGLSLAVLTNITIAGKSFIGGHMEITVVSSMTAKNELLQDDSGYPKFSAGDCQISLVSIKTNLPSSVLPKLVNKFLNSTLQKVLPDLLCPAVDAVLALVNQKFTTMISPHSVGAAGSIQYVLLSPPVTSDDFIELDLNTKVLQEGGELIDLPIELPPLTSLPPKMDLATQLVLSVNFLSAELTLIQTSFNLDVTDTTVLGLPPLTVTTLGALIPMVSESLPPSQPMVIEIRITKPPLLTMQQDKGLVHIFATAEFLTSQPDAAHESLFVLNIHINLGTQFSIVEEKLRVSLALDR
ncbi:BPI fold-containing family B member 6 [Emydura macquarii macquarii]|uniref:BPI fold-containing family B member 6 n=1 Tax=Emydura macquarii macquarii TaxID=1129001 RepID=UPI00352BA15B